MFFSLGSGWRKAMLHLLAKAASHIGSPTNSRLVEAAPTPPLTAATIKIHQNNYLNNSVNQDHRAGKQIVRPLRDFNAFSSARRTLSGIEIMLMVKKS